MADWFPAVGWGASCRGTPWPALLDLSSPAKPNSASVFRLLCRATYIFLIYVPDVAVARVLVLLDAHVLVVAQARRVALLERDVDVDGRVVVDRVVDQLRLIGC